MITPMTRYEFLLYHTDVALFLERTRELGMVDITLKDVALSDDQRELLDKSELYKSVSRQMEGLIKKEKIGIDSNGGKSDEHISNIVNTWGECKARIISLENSIEKGKLEAEELEKWGEFDVNVIEGLAKQGLELRFFEIANKSYSDQIANEFPIEVVARNEHFTYFVVVVNAGERFLDIPGNEMKVPSMSESQKREQIERLEKSLVNEREKLSQMAVYAKEVEVRGRKYEEEFDLNRVVNAGEELVENRVRLLEGWCETTNSSKIEEFAKGEDVIYNLEEAKAEQNPPIKLKNNWFSGLFEVIGKLYMMPRYDELDMTPFFAPFFMIFFGMCFGDAGYGLLILLAVALFWKKIPANFKSIAWLVIFLNISAIVFGALSGNVCGIELIKIEALANFKQYFALSNPNTVFYFAIFLGGVQVLFGQILRIFNRMKRGGGFIYGVSSIGWVTLFISSIVAFITDQTSEIWFYIALGLAGIMIVFFANPKANVFASAGKGLYSVYEMATGVVGDLISYVRLFAIGLAGAIIAQVFNELALGLSGDIIIVKQLVMAAILIFGHGLNIFISILGAFVHPVRLTFVEFFKNAEFEGGGREFNPLRKKA